MLRRMADISTPRAGGPPAMRSPKLGSNRPHTQGSNMRGTRTPFTNPNFINANSVSPGGQEAFQRRLSNQCVEQHRRVRLRQQEIIHHENNALLKRLEDGKSTYNKQAWKEDRKVNRDRVKMICQYKPSLLEPATQMMKRRRRQQNLAISASRDIGVKMFGPQINYAGEGEANFESDGGPIDSYTNQNFAEMQGYKQAVEIVSQENKKVSGPLRVMGSQNTEFATNSETATTECAEHKHGIQMPSDLPPLNNGLKPMTHDEFNALKDSLTVKMAIEQQQQPPPTAPHNLIDQFQQNQANRRNLRTEGGSRKNKATTQQKMAQNFLSEDLHQLHETGSIHQQQQQYQERDLTPISDVTAPLNSSKFNRVTPPKTTTEVHVIQATDRMDLNNLPKNLINIVAKKRPQPLNIGQQNSQVDPKRKVLYRNFHEINCHIYLVEISRNKQKVFILLFPNFEQTDNFMFEILPQKLACKMMRDCSNQFEAFIAKFHIKYDRLQIEGYHHGSFNSNKGSYQNNTCQPVSAGFNQRRSGTQKPRQISSVQPAHRNAAIFSIFNTATERTSPSLETAPRGVGSIRDGNVDSVLQSRRAEGTNDEAIKVVESDPLENEQRKEGGTAQEKGYRVEIVNSNDYSTKDVQKRQTFGLQHSFEKQKQSNQQILTEPLHEVGENTSQPRFRDSVDQDMGGAPDLCSGQDVQQTEKQIQNEQQLMNSARETDNTTMVGGVVIGTHSTDVVLQENQQQLSRDEQCSTAMAQLIEEHMTSQNMGKDNNNVEMSRQNANKSNVQTHATADVTTQPQIGQDQQQQARNQSETLLLMATDNKSADRQYENNAKNQKVGGNRLAGDGSATEVTHSVGRASMNITKKSADVHVSQPSALGGVSQVSQNELVTEQ